MKTINTIPVLAVALLAGTAVAHEKAKQAAKGCKHSDITCAKTVTSAFTSSGDLWRLWSAGKHMYYSVSNDMGKHFGEPHKVGIAPEKIASRGENRPKLAFDGRGNVYISWAKPLKKTFYSRCSFYLFG